MSYTIHIHTSHRVIIWIGQVGKLPRKIFVFKGEIENRNIE